MTITNAIELAVFISQWVTAIVDRARKAFERGEFITIEEMHAATDEIFAQWERDKARDWRRVEELAEQREGNADKTDQ